MALTQIKSDGIANAAITTQQLAPGAAGGPKITQIQITDSGGTVLDDTAIGLSGGYIKITGTGFAAGAQVIVNNTPATSTTFTSTTVLNAQVGAQSAGTYVVYVVNTDGGVAIAVNGLTYSDTPTWVTSSTLDNQLTDVPISIQLSATGANTYALDAGSSLPDGLTLSSGGLLSGTVSILADTTYSFTVNAIDTELQDSPRTFSLTVSIVIPDPYFYLTTLLLPGNGTNNGTNNTFLDSSTNNFTVTRNGNTTQGTYTPYRNLWSNYFDGTGDYFGVTGTLGIANNAFTICFWFFPLSSSVIGLFDSGASTVGVIRNYPANSIQTQNGGTVSFAGAYTANAWNWMCITKSGTSFTVYVNGTNVGTGACSSAVAENTFKIGGINNGGDGSYFGYISDFRIINNAATIFAPPTAPLTAITGTSLLTCQSNRFIDSSTNNFPITTAGNVSIQPFSPYNPTEAYSVNTNGGGAYFDGSGDYLSVADNIALDAFTDFTIEGWVYFISAANNQCIVTKGWDASSTLAPYLLYTSSGNLVFSASTDGSNWAILNQTVISGISTGRWYHFAVTRSGSTVRYFNNGALTGTSTVSAALMDSIYNLTVGSHRTGGYYLNGYLSGFRIVKGTAVYTSAFTPPTTPPTAIANTSLLLNYTNGQITDATSMNELYTVGSAAISTSQYKFGTSSLYIPSTADAATTLAGVDLQGDFTIEGWVKPAISGGEKFFIIQGVNLTNGFLIGLTTTEIRWRSNGSSDISASISKSDWYHFAITRSGSATNNVKVFVDGTQVTQGTYTNQILASAGVLNIGPAGLVGGFASYGYIQDFRITRGYARYTANFTPPTTAFPLQ